MAGSIAVRLRDEKQGNKETGTVEKIKRVGL
jgi:hypothetical protein